MLLFCNNITPRVRYIVDFIAKQLFDQPIDITSDTENYLTYEGYKINYSDQELQDGEFFIKPHGLLFETNIRPQQVNCFEVNYHVAFFQTSGDFPFDVFAAAFYLMSRYEEYLPHEKDAFGRYAHTNSLAWREGFLKTPLINIWLRELQKAIEHKFNHRWYHSNTFKFLPTYDVDIAYAFLHKGFKRNAGALLQLLLRGDWVGLKNRTAVLMHKKDDPYDAYEWLDSLHLYCRTRAYYFFLIAKQQRGFDKNISPRKKALQDLISYHASGYTVGLHPSWQSGDDEEILQQEKVLMDEITGKNIAYSRQHYIRFDLPATYRKLLACGIEKDFSMGYGTVNGFRASVASSFFWYDLEAEKQTRLLIFPFCFMDANAHYQEKMQPGEAFTELMQFYNTIKKVNGLMVTIWHNQFLGNDPLMKDWKALYEIFMKEEVYWDT